MRKVKIISSSELPILHMPNDLEIPLNSAFEEIDKMGGKIVKTEYFASHHGTLESAIIEYEVL